MYNIKSVILILLLLFSFCVQASIDNAWLLYRKGARGIKYYPTIAKELIEDGYYFAAVPFIKEYLTLVGNVSSTNIDKIIDQVVTFVGVRQFDTLPKKVLSKSRSPMIRYILAKKYIRVGKYNHALRILSGSISSDHPAKPFALMLEASAHAVTKNYSAALLAYNQCVDSSESFIGDESDPNRIRQLSINRDYCIVGIARIEFATGKYQKANLHYLDLSKSSYVWPEILFEEAWTSFYMKDYNRTLGKLVSYNAPFFDYIFNPEVDVLKALTYLHLCLWSDTKKTVDAFYRKYQADSKSMRIFLQRSGKNYKYFFQLAKSHKESRAKGNRLLDKLLKAVVRDAAFIELYESYKQGKNELKRLSKFSSGGLRNVMMRNVKSALLLQRNLIGAYVRKGLLLYQSQMEQSFEYMSNIKLEVLSRRKSEIYASARGGSKKRKRGDIKYLKRNEKQYFWDFHGEFWADELGDYVFALKSECL